VDFRELDNHLAAKLPRIHTGRQWQSIIYFYKEIERELKEWRRMEKMEKDVIEAVRRVMET